MIDPNHSNQVTPKGYRTRNAQYSISMA